jgi:hypothetical protein
MIVGDEILDEIWFRVLSLPIFRLLRSGFNGGYRLGLTATEQWCTHL